LTLFYMAWSTMTCWSCRTSSRRTYSPPSVAPRARRTARGAD